MTLLVSGRASEATDGGGIDLDRLAALEERIRELENAERPAEVAPAPATLVPTIVREPSDDRSGGGRIASLEARLGKLEALELGREEAARKKREFRARREAERRLSRQQRVVQAQRVILNAAATEEAKVHAWGNLRHTRGSGWTDEIVRRMAHLGATAASAAVRADVWRQADANCAHPLLLQPLLTALARDKGEQVREEAAETLANYLDQPGVIAALRLASTQDVHEDVRREATRTLARKKR